MARQTRFQNTKNQRKQDKQFRNVLEKYVLAGSSEAGNSFVRHLCAAYRDKNIYKYVKFQGEKGFFREMIEPLLGVWGYKIDDDDQSARSTETIYLRIPTIQERQKDIPRIISFFFQQHLHNKLQAGQDTITHPTSISGWLLLCITVYVEWKSFDDLQEFCVQSIDWSKGKIINFDEAIKDSAAKFREMKMHEIRDDKREFPELYEREEFLSFLSMDEVRAAHQRMAKDENRNVLVDSYLFRSKIRDTDKDEEEEYLNFPLNAVKQVMDNIRSLNKSAINEWTKGERDQVSRYFEYRDEGKKKKDIVTDLKLKNVKKLNSWVRSHHINLVFRKSDTVYEDWLAAKNELGVKDTTVDMSRSRFLSVETFREVSFDGEFLLPTDPQALFMKTIHNYPKSEVPWEYIKLKEPTLSSYGNPSKIFKNGPDGKTLWEKAIKHPSQGRKALYSFHHEPTIVTSLD